MSMLRNATWTLSNFCRGKPQPDFQQVGVDWGGARQAMFAAALFLEGCLERFHKPLQAAAPLMRVCCKHGNTAISTALVSPQVKSALPALARLIHSQDEEVLTDACWALSYLSDGTNDKIQARIVGWPLLPCAGAVCDGVAWGWVQLRPSVALALLPLLL